MKKNIHEPFKIEENSLAANNLKLVNCAETFKLKPEDEISLDSILSALLERVEPTKTQFENLKFEVTAKDLRNDKQAIIFEENLFISKLKDKSCQLMIDERKIFLESDLKEIGSFTFNVEESYDGYVVLGNSKLLKDRRKFKSGHWFKGKYDDKLKLLAEKRSEYDFVDNARIEKSLNARSSESQLIVERETKINNHKQHFRAIINVKDRPDAFLLEGGVLLYVRYLIVNNMFGDFNYFSMNIFGKVLRCQLTICRERKQIKMFHRCFQHAIHVRNTQYFNDCAQEISDTYYTATGKMILHFWHNFNYVFHETKGFVSKPDIIVPKLELMWRSHNQLLDQYRLKEKLTYKTALAYFEKHPELIDFLSDYVRHVIKFKPHNLLEFSVKYFQKFKNPIV